MASAIEAGADFVQSWLSSAHFKDVPGGIVAASVDGETILNQSYGFADIESAAPMSPNSQFQIASQSKLFTATSIMQLQEKGALSISDLASKYIPELKAAADPRSSTITIEQLLTHTSGLSRDSKHAGFWEMDDDFPTQQGVLDILAKEPLALSPSTQMKYSNLGYAALGAIIERVSDLPYDVYVTESIIQPLGLTGTSVDKPLHSSTPTAYGSEVDGKRAQLPLASTRAFAPATGIYSTTEDLLLFFSQFNTSIGNSPILDKETIEAMSHARVKARYSGGVEYGFGVDIGTDDGVTIIGHGGGFPGHKSGTIVDVANNITVSAFANSIETDAFSASIDTARVLRYFIKQGPIPDNHRELYDTTLESIWRKRRLVSVGNKVLSIYPGAYNPFSDSSAETLTPIDKDRLLITQANSFDGVGEEVLFPANDTDHVIYAGRRLKKV